MLTRIAICALSVGLAASPESTQPEPQRRLDELVPAPCLLFVSLNVPALLDGLRRSPLKDAWESSGLGEDWSRAMESLSDKLAEDLMESDFEPEDFSWVLAGEVGFMVGRVDTERGDDGKLALPSMALIVDAGERTQELDAFVRKWVDSLREDGERVLEEDFRGSVLHVVEQVDDEDAEEDSNGPFRKPAELCFARVGSLLAVSFDSETARTLLRAATGDEIAVLAEDPDYRLVRQRTGRPDAFSYYVDLEHVLDTARSAQTDDEERAIFDEIVAVAGASAMRAVGGGAAIRADGVWNDVFLLDGGPREGLVWDVLGASGPTVPPGFLPQDVDGFQLLYVDFESFWSDVVRLVEIIGEADPTMPPDPLGMAEEQLGFRLGDVFASLQGEVTLFKRMKPGPPGARDPLAGMPMMGFPGAGGDVVLRLREAQTLEQARVKLEALARAQDPGGWPFEEQDYLGRILHVLKPELAGRMAEVGLAPCFTITENLFAFSMSTENLQSVVRRLGAADGGVAEAENYRRAAEHLPPTASWVSYTSAATLDKSLGQMEMMLDMLGSMAPAEQTDDVELIRDMLPKLRELLGSFDGAIGYARTSAEGCVFTNAWLFADED